MQENGIKKGMGTRNSYRQRRGAEIGTRTERRRKRNKRTNTKHIYTHRYSPQNIGAEKGAEKEQERRFLREGSLFPYQSSLNSGLSSMAVRPTVQAQHKQYTTTHTGIHQTSPSEQNKKTNEQTTEEQRLNNKETYKHIKSMHT